MWHIISTKEKIQEFREEKTYSSYKKRHECIDLHPVNAVLTKLKVKDLIPTVAFHGRIYSAVEDSIKRIGLKDPFLIHFVTDVPVGFKHGLFIKSGNNRFYVCKKLGMVFSLKGMLTTYNINVPYGNDYKASDVKGLWDRMPEDHWIKNWQQVIEELREDGLL